MHWDSALVRQVSENATPQTDRQHLFRTEKLMNDTEKEQQVIQSWCPDGPNHSASRWSSCSTIYKWGPGNSESPQGSFRGSMQGRHRQENREKTKCTQSAPTCWKSPCSSLDRRRSTDLIALHPHPPGSRSSRGAIGAHKTPSWFDRMVLGAASGNSCRCVGLTDTVRRRLPGE